LDPIEDQKEQLTKPFGDDIISSDDIQLTHDNKGELHFSEKVLQAETPRSVKSSSDNISARTPTPPVSVATDRSEVDTAKANNVKLSSAPPTPSTLSAANNTVTNASSPQMSGSRTLRVPRSGNPSRSDSLWKSAVYSNSQMPVGSVTYHLSDIRSPNWSTLQLTVAKSSQESSPKPSEHSLNKKQSFEHVDFEGYALKKVRVIQYFVRYLLI
jgi:hypothetical protein